MRSRVPGLLGRFWPLRILLVGLLAAGALAGIYRGTTSWLRWRTRRDSRFCIARLVESSEGPMGLRAGTIEALLNLKPARHNLFAFDVERAQESLCAHPIIRSARVWRCPPHTLSVCYCTRDPLAQLPEWPNLALDPMGWVFPISPFLTPKRLPKLILGLPEPEAGGARNWCNRPSRLRGNRADFGLEVLQYVSRLLAGEGTRISRVDVSRAFAGNLGERHLGLVLEDQLFIEGKPLVCRRYIKLDRVGWRDQLGRYRRLHLRLARQELLAVRALSIEKLEKRRFELIETIDLRLDRLAFIRLRLRKVSKPGKGHAL